MAEWIVSSLLSKLDPLIVKEFAFLWGLKDELAKLKTEMEAVSLLLRDAETRRLTAADPINTWLEKLRDVTYDAEDTIDEFWSYTHAREVAGHYGQQNQPLLDTAIYYLRQHFRGHAIRAGIRTCASEVRRAINSLFHQIRFRREIGNRIKEINGRLDEITKERRKYNLDMIPQSSSTGYVEFARNRRQTTSTIIESEIVGRNSEAKLLLEWLVKDFDRKGENVSVVSVVGMGGVGKTALAKTVYSAPQLQERFQRTIWICVLENPKKEWLAAKILEGIREDGCYVNENIVFDYLHCQIRENLKGKRFLLVLDDAWDIDWYEDLKATLESAAPGSRILVTTRIQGVSEWMNAVYMCRLNVLSERESWALFLRFALRDGEEEGDIERLKDIASSIVKRCRGLPLALKTVGRVMASRRRTRLDWVAVSNSKTWNWKSTDQKEDEGVLPALLMSYISLPMYLKHCFAYFAIFPEDYRFKTTYLCRLLIAGGFITDAEGDMDTKADEFVEDLASRSLLEVEKRDPVTGDILEFTLHHAVHDLAIYIAGKEYSSSLADAQARHLMLLDNFYAPFPIPNYSKLRTLLWRGVIEPPCELFKCIRCLRVLDLQKSGICELPESAGDLILLKYLNLSWTKIRGLPKSIGKLCNLQTLDLEGSDIEELPEEIVKLKNLRHLDLQDTQKLEYMPRGMSMLTSLRTLSCFMLGEGGDLGAQGLKISELKGLNKLKGVLVIYNLERVSSPTEAREALLSEKHSLSVLKLISEETEEGKEGIVAQAEKVLEELQPPSQLEILEVNNYKGRMFPRSWFWNVNFLNLREVNLQGCNLLEQLPPLGHLPLLICLSVGRANKVKYLHKQFFGNGSGFIKLKNLHFSQLYSWEEWPTGIEREAMCSLQSLRIDECPRMMSLPSLSSIKELSLNGCTNLVRLPRLPSLVSLEMMGCERLEWVSDLPSLMKLEMLNCDNLQFVSNLKALRKLEICSCRSLCTLSELPALEQMGVKGCDGLHALPIMDSLRQLEIMYCNNLVELPFFPSMASLSVRNSGNWDQVSWFGGGSFPCIQSLTMADCGAMKAVNQFPASLLEVLVISCEVLVLPELPSSLNKLQIEDCFELHTLWEYQKKPSKLKVLTLLNCPKMARLPCGIEFLRDLVELKVEDCPLLEDNCKRGEEWQKISHIKTMMIGSR